MKYTSVRLIQGRISIERDTIEPDSLRDDEVIVKIERMGICRADVKEVYTGRNIPENRGPLFGHEFVGVVVSAGRRTGVKTGNRVSFNPNITPDRTTGFAEYFMIRGTEEKVKKALNVVPEELSSEIAVFSEPFSCVIRSIDKLLKHMGLKELPLAVKELATDKNELAGKKIAVIGAGNAGMYHAWLLSLLWGEVTIANINDGRLEFIKKRKLFDGTAIIFDEHEENDVIIKHEGHEGKYDVVILATTRITAKTFRLSLQLVMNKGYIHIYAGTRKDDSFEGVDNIDYIRRNERKRELYINGKHVFITGAYGSEHDDFLKAFNYLQESAISEKIQNMIYKFITLEELPELIMVMADGTKDQPGKVIVLPN